MVTLLVDENLVRDLLYALNELPNRGLSNGQCTYALASRLDSVLISATRRPVQDEIQILPFASCNDEQKDLIVRHYPDARVDDGLMYKLNRIGEPLCRIKPGVAV